MVKIWTDPSRIYSRVHRVSRQSADDTLAKVRDKLTSRTNHPYATGALAASYHIEVEEVSSDGVDMVLASDAPYASAIEHGAWVEGRGPHISGSGRRKRRGTGYVNRGRGEVAATLGIKVIRSRRGRSYRSGRGGFWGSQMTKRLREAV